MATLKTMSPSEALSEAIKSGFLAVEAERAYKSILAENTVLKGQIKALQQDLKIADGIMSRDREIWVEVLSKCLKV